MTQELIERIKHQIKQLNNLNENLYESEECLKLLNSIDKSYTDKASQSRVAEVLAENNYPAICVNLLRYYNKKYIFANDNVWFSTFYLLRAIWNYTNHSAQLRMQVADCGFIPILLSILSNPSIVDNLDENEEQALKVSINILHNIAQQPETKVTFREHKATKIIKAFTNINHDHLKVLGYLCLAHIVNEDEIGELNDSAGGTIKFIINNLKECYKKLDRKFRGIYAREYLAGLDKLAVVRENKFKMVECEIFPIFKEILKYDNPADEIKPTLNCIWNMCFEEQLSESLKNDKELMNILNNFCENTPSDELRKKCNGIFYTMNNLSKKGDTKTLSKQKPNPKGHVMISYNSNSRELCVKIKDKLKKDGFRVWIDTEQIQGSALQSMAEAIENAAVVLSCITERYYQSPNCRLEVEYAVKLNKPLIPILMQHKYIPQGWLGISVGTKIYYNFASYSMDEKYPSLIKEISHHYGVYETDNDNSSTNTSPRKSPSKNSTINSITSSNSATKLIIKTNDSNMINNNLSNNTNIKPNVSKMSDFKTQKKIRNWTVKDVNEWIDKLNLTSVEVGAFDDIDGACLTELHEIKQNAPEFFNQLLKEKLTTWRKLNTGDWEKYYKLSDFLKFSLELTNLFKEEN